MEGGVGRRWLCSGSGGGRPGVAASSPLHRLAWEVGRMGREVGHMGRELGHMVQEAGHMGPEVHRLVEVDRFHEKGAGTVVLSLEVCIELVGCRWVEDHILGWESHWVRSDPLELPPDPRCPCLCEELGLEDDPV